MLSPPCSCILKHLLGPNKCLVYVIYLFQKFKKEPVKSVVFLPKLFIIKRVKLFIFVYINEDLVLLPEMLTLPFPSVTRLKLQETETSSHTTYIVINFKSQYLLPTWHPACCRQSDATAVWVPIFAYKFQ